MKWLFNYSLLLVSYKWYNTNIHASTKLSPFEAVYGYPPPSLLAHSPGITAVQTVKETLRSRDQILRLLRGNLQVAQERMKRFADLKRIERYFE